jgi:FtsP/CotA-like multicopper oxidase with cupredoxin domain
MGITVTGPSRVVAAPAGRPLRLLVQPRPGRYGSAPGFGYVLQDGARAPAADSIAIPGPTIVLRRDEPVAITIVNHLARANAGHWHGIELDSYYYGVGGWSGGADGSAATTPMIAPGDSFVAEFTPPRSGTFMYHAHSNESFQISLGLYGGLLVVDSGAYHPERERLIILGGNGPGERGARINGRLKPDTLRLTAGETYRLRIVHIVPDWTVRVALKNGEATEQWRAVAKDGAELPSHRQTVRAADFVAGPGETLDFEYRPAVPGLMTLSVAQRTGEWSTALPIRVESSRVP